MRRAWLPSPAAAVAAFVFFLSRAGYPWQLALLTATAIGALVYSAQRTWARMRRLLPGEGRQRQQKQQMQPTAEDETGHEQDHPRRE